MPFAAYILFRFRHAADYRCHCFTIFLRERYTLALVHACHYADIIAVTP